MIVKSNSLSTALGFPFEDPHWLMKLSIGSLLILASLVIPLIPLFFVAGYCLRIIQRIILGDGQAVLPEWDDWSWLFKHGFKLSEAGLLYALPGLLLLTIGSVMIFFPLYGMGLASLASATHQAISPAGMTMLTKGTLISGIGLLLTLVGGFFSTPAAMHMAAKNRVKAVLQIHEWWVVLSRAPWKFFSAYGLVAVITILLMIFFTILTATLVFCIPAAILFSVANMYLAITASALFASAYRAGAMTTQINGGMNDGSK
jgi:Protein of unknown function (DUF4013)